MSAINQLFEIIDDNIKYFAEVEKCQDLNTSLNNFKKSLEECEKNVKEIESFASLYDFSAEVPGNGFRSFIDIIESAIKKSTKICTLVIRNRGKILFRSDYYAKEIEEWDQIIQSLSIICAGLIETHQSNAGSKNLYQECSNYDNVVTRTLKNINQAPFYGKNLGFQFCASMRPIIKFIVVSMACYFSFYFKNKPKPLRVLRFPISFAKCHLSSNKRAAKSLHAYDNSTTEFCRSFWFLNEGKIAHSLPSLIAHKVDVNKVFKISPDAMRIYSTKASQMVDVPLPSSHIGLKPVSCRLISARKRKGMIGAKTNSKTAESSKYLIFHVHGGGWAAQTSKSHELYLREWAVKLDVPILSIDYSLAPEAPFPRALEEVFYAYCWALNNPELVGSTGEHIVFVGDSAGGNLNTACVVKAIEMGIPIPKGLFNIYTPYDVSFTIAPSRFLALIDPVLPYGFSSRLFKSYAKLDHNVDMNMNHESPEQIIQKVEGKKSKKKPKQMNTFESPDEEFNVAINNSYLISPYYAPDEIISKFPPTKLLSTNLDPCLDDNVEFGKKLRRLNVETELDIVKGLAHGFLYFTQPSKECHDAAMLCMERIKNLL